MPFKLPNLAGVTVALERFWRSHRECCPVKILRFRSRYSRSLLIRLSLLCLLVEFRFKRRRVGIDGWCSLRVKHLL